MFNKNNRKASEVVDSENRQAGPGHEMAQASASKRYSLLNGLFGGGTSRGGSQLVLRAPELQQPRRPASMLRENLGPGRSDSNAMLGERLLGGSELEEAEDGAFRG